MKIYLKHLCIWMFVLFWRALDKTDLRKLDVADTLDIWAENEVKLGYSNHTFNDVTNRLFLMLVLGSLQVYHEKSNFLTILGMVLIN